MLCCPKLHQRISPLVFNLASDKLLRGGGRGGGGSSQILGQHITGTVSIRAANIVLCWNCLSRTAAVRIALSTAVFPAPARMACPLLDKDIELIFPSSSYQGLWESLGSVQLPILPASVSQVAGLQGIYHHAWLWVTQYYFGTGHIHAYYRIFGKYDS